MIGHMIWCPHPYPLQEVQSAPGQGRNWPPHFFIASYASEKVKMTSGVQLIYGKVPIGANLLKNAENDYSFQSIYVKSHFKQLL